MNLGTRCTRYARRAADPGEIGRRQPVRVKFLCYEGTMQARCLRLMGKKLLVVLAMEGKFAGEGLQSLSAVTGTRQAYVGITLAGG